MSRIVRLIVESRVDVALLGAKTAEVLALPDKQTSTIFDLASSYGYGFARNHCFPDGNKRVALVALVSIDVFLMANGHELIAQETEAVITISAVAEGRMSENDLSAWIQSNATTLLEEI